MLLTLADRPVLALFMGADSPALPIARHIHLVATWNFLLFGVMMVLFATVRANGAVWVPLIILAVGLVPVRFGYICATYGWLGADAIWTSFPVTSLINLALATAFYLHGGWRKARMTRRAAPGRRRMHRGSAGDARAGRRSIRRLADSHPAQRDSAAR